MGRGKEGMTWYDEFRTEWEKTGCQSGQSCCAGMHVVHEGKSSEDCHGEMLQLVADGIATMRRR